MTKFLCWLFGHKWRPWSRTDYPGLTWNGTTCKRCGWIHARMEVPPGLDIDELFLRQALEHAEAKCAEYGGTLTWGTIDYGGGETVGVP